MRGLWIGLVLSLLFLVIFAGVGYLATRPPNQLTEFDERVGLRLEQERLAYRGVRGLVGGVTHAGDKYVMAALGLFVAALLWWRRERLMALACLVTTAGGGAFNLYLKKFFERKRPWFQDPDWVKETTESFPSGHAMGAVIGYGLLAFALMLIVRNQTLRVVTLTVLSVVVLLVGFSRIYLGAHFFSDVLGGYAIAGAWLAAWLAFMQTLRHHPPEGPPPQPPSKAREKVGV
jgi:undecaprenyl-diphosphatase